MKIGQAALFDLLNGVQAIIKRFRPIAFRAIIQLKWSEGCLYWPDGRRAILTAIDRGLREDEPSGPAVPTAATPWRLSKLDFAFMGIATTVAAVFRLYEIDSLPPGLHYDEAFLGVAAGQLLETLRPVVFYEGNFGTEALAAYLVAGLDLIFGRSATTIRLMSAIVGILTVPALYLLVRELFPGGPWGFSFRTNGFLSRNHPRLLAFLSALVLAILYWHVHFSRYGVESNLVPLFEVVAFCFLWRGFRARRLGSFAISGVVFGLSLYTYRAALLLPVLLGLFLVYRVLRERRSFIAAFWKGTLCLGVAAFIVLVPLGRYFIEHPEVVTLRQNQVNVVGQGQSSADAILANVNKAAAMFLIHGDENPRSNLPGRPVLDQFLAIPFLVGSILVVSRLGRAQYGFLAIWFVVMMVPTAVSELAPHFRRTLGTVPAVAIFVALGFTGILTVGCSLADRLLSPMSGFLRRATAVGVMLAVIGSGFLTYRDYFLVWGGSNSLFSAFDVGITDVMRSVNSLPRDSEVYLSPIPQSHQTIQFLSDRGPRVKSFDGRKGFVFPAKPGKDAVYVVMTQEDSRSMPFLRTSFPEARSIKEGKTWSGLPYFNISLVPAKSTRNIGPRYPLKANLGNKIELLGYDALRFTYKPGDVIPLNLYWHALGSLKESYTVFVQIVGPWNARERTFIWGQKDRLPLGGTFKTDKWNENDLVRDDYAPPIRKDAPPGEYEIRVGMYLLSTMQRLPVIDEASGKVVDDKVTLAKIKVQGP